MLLSKWADRSLLVVAYKTWHRNRLRCCTNYRLLSIISPSSPGFMCFNTVDAIN